jgi:hypothetical protein
MNDEPVFIEVEAFQWDDENIGHLHSSVTMAMIEQARLNNPIYLINKPGRAATHVMIGQAENGTHVHVAILQISEGLWRPITGWRSRRAYQVWNRIRG